VRLHLTCLLLKKIVIAIAFRGDEICTWNVLAVVDMHVFVDETIKKLKL
jgi:hypothetical protein